MKRLLLVGSCVAAAMMIVGALTLWYWKRHLEPSGGLYFARELVLDVPLFRQGDARWRDDFLALTEGTLGAEGCAVAAAAMVLGYYGVETDPGALNAFLNTCEGYTPQGWIYWEKAAELAPERVRHVYEDDPSHQLIDTNLLAGNPVIVRLRYPHGITHFVVIVGKRGFDYLIRDPGAGGTKGVYPLHEFGSRIEALRFYHRVSPVPANA